MRWQAAVGIIATACFSIYLILGPLSHATVDLNPYLPVNETITVNDIFEGYGFTPRPVFENVNLVRNINLEKAYPKETVNVVVRNIGKDAEDQYYLAFDTALQPKVGSLEVRDKNNPSKGRFDVSAVKATDENEPIRYYRIDFPNELKPKEELTLSISYFTPSALEPLPAKIEQSEKQHLKYTFNAYSPSAYLTSKQKTKLKFPSAKVPDFSTLPAKSKDGIKSDNKEDPVRQGTSFTYGPFSSVSAGTVEKVYVRFEHTAPLAHVDLLERDIEVSHWGGNLATEERYWVVNRGAALKTQFSRVQWQQQSYFNPESVALRGFIVPLRAGSTDAYYIDDVGNVSTSRYTIGKTKAKDGLLELKPRYPVFGDWRYKFKIGWNNPLHLSLRKVKDSNTHILKVPFLEGPKGPPEGVEYDKVVLRAILPEGAYITGFRAKTPGLISYSVHLHRTFMDTKGRTVLVLTALNLNEEWARDDDNDAYLYITYEYTLLAGYRKPAAVSAAVFAIFATAWLVGLADVQIRGKK